MTFFGLSEREAEASRKKYGFNEYLYKPSAAGNILRGFNGLSCKLFSAAALAEIIRTLLSLIGYIGSEADFARSAALLGLGILSAFAEAALSYRSERVINELCGSEGETKYTVFVNKGKTEKVPRKMLTVGDAVFLSEGDVVPADGIMADGSLTVDQSVLGVIGKAEKTVPPDSYRKGSVTGPDNPYAVYSGTLVCGGSGIVKITAVGGGTEFGRKNEPKAVEIHALRNEKYVAAFRTGAAVSLAAALAVLIFGTVTGALSGQLIGGLARGISMFAAVTAVACFCGKNLIFEAETASALKRLDRKGVRISDPDTLNSGSDIGIAVTERAGMIAEPEYSANGTVFIDGSGKEYRSFGALGAGLSEILKNAVVCTSSAVTASDGKVLGGNALDRALYGFLGRKADKVPELKKQTEVKAAGGSVLSGATVSAGGKLFTFVRGGAEIMLDRCSDSVGADGRKQKITNKSALQKLAAAIALTGKDMVALAVSERGIKEGRLPSGGYALIGLAALYDSPFENAADEVKRLEKLGVKVLLATEESRESSLFAAKYAGISGAKKASKGSEKNASKKSSGIVLSSDQLAKMSDRELAGRLNDIKAVVRAAPSDRGRLIRAAHDNGIKVCVSASEVKDMKSVSEADMIIAAAGCSTAVSVNADAAADKCGIKSLADIIECSAKYAARCGSMTILRAVCAAAAAAIGIFLR